MFSNVTTTMKSTLSLTLASIALLAGCDSDSSSNIEQSTPFTLSFAAKSAGEAVVCDSTHDNFGSGDDGLHSISVSDLRFYVSNIKFYDENNNELSAELDENDFQLHHEQGFVGLVDLTSNTLGACADEALGGTERTNSGISGTVLNGTVTTVSFDVGVPQAVMKDVIATNTQEDAPTPLNEMYWSWSSGYRHFVMNFQIEESAEAVSEHLAHTTETAEVVAIKSVATTDETDHSAHSDDSASDSTTGKGAIHIGSTGCSGVDDAKALESKDSCDSVNTAKVTLNNFDLTTNTIAIDIDALLTNVQFSATGSETVPTISCHSSAGQADCSAIFENIGLDITDGTADAATNLVFFKE